MNDNDSDDGDGYKVGPGRPPREHRWKKGQPSPNPLGRPPKKGSESGLFALIDPRAAAVIAFDNGTIGTRSIDGEEITRAEAYMGKLYKDAMTGNYRAMVHYLKITENAHRIWQEHLITLATNALQYRDLWLPRFQFAAARGAPLPNQFPDPRDIEIGDDMSVKIYGPSDREGRALQDRVVAERDAFLEFIELSPEQVERMGAKEAKNLVRRVKRKVKQYNELLPPRLRRTR